MANEFHQSPRRPETGLRARKIEAVHEILDTSSIRVVFQPIVHMKSGQIFGYEALARTNSPYLDNIEELFVIATQAGRVGELGRLHRTQAIRQCPNAILFLNVYPNEFDYGWMVRPDDPIFLHKDKVYLEITESVPLSHFRQCQSVLSEVRKKGVQLAIDDLGAGYSNLKYIADLTPEIVKLDRDLVAGIREGSSQFQLLKSIVTLCQNMGARVVAEGIETRKELAAVEKAGVDYCQGFLIARPACPPPEIFWPRYR